MPKENVINTEPQTRLPSAEGQIVVVAEKLVAKRQITPENGNPYDKYEIQVVLGKDLAGMQLMPQDRRVNVSANGVNGKMMEAAIGHGPFLAEIYKSKGGYFNMKHICNLGDLTAQAEEIQSAIKAV